MSRIDKALEKASRMRQTGKASASTATVGAREVSRSQPVFEVGESLIDPAAVHKHIVCVTAPFSSAAEQYKKLRARIFKTAEKDFLNSILVASAFEGEGKTTTALNLAITIAQEIDHTVLLIDADLRKPSVHTYLGLKPQYGLSDYLQSKAELSDVLIKTGIGKLVVLPAGNPPPNPSELLASEKMRDLIHEMKYRYRDRYIIFDSSPLLTTADGLYLKEYIDGVIFVVQAARTSEKAAAQALSLLKGSNIFGTIFNNVPEYVSTHATSYHGRTQTVGQEGIFNAAGLMGWAENVLASVGALLHRDRLLAVGKKLKTGISGLAKRTKE
jgi:protein-tyrosine kinase